MSGRIRVPGDKVISHRGPLFGSLATGVSAREIRHLLADGDVTAHCGSALRPAWPVAEDPSGTVTVTGAGVVTCSVRPTTSWTAPTSGTSIRLLCGLPRGPAVPQRAERRRFAAATPDAAGGGGTKRQWVMAPTSTA